jgi:D-xylose transport system substrate-binding protein
MRTKHRAAATLAAALLTGGLLTACGSDDDDSATSGAGTTAAAAATTGADTTGTSAAGSGKAVTVSLLLPETKTTRYEAHDRPRFEEKLKAECPDCKLLYSNANQDATKQQAQAEAAITNGADVIVLDAVDGKSAATIVNRAKQADVPVVAYDRLISDAPIASYVSFDNIKVGQAQAQALLDKIGDPAGKSIVMINGAPTDASAGDYKKGAHSVLDKSGVKIAKEYDTPDWSPDKAQREMEQAITALGKDGFAGIYAANDGTAGGAIAALEGAGIPPSSKPITGQDAEVTAVQRILSGDQYMTIYLQIKAEAEAAAELALAAARDEAPPAGLINAKVDNGMEEVPSVLLDPTPVTKDTVKETIVADGFLTAKDLCTPAYAKACAAAGIS